MDDLFIIVQSWSNISASIHRSQPIEERIGLALKHSVSLLKLGAFFGFPATVITRSEAKVTNSVFSRNFQSPFILS